MKKTFTIGTSTIPGEVILPHLMPQILKQNLDLPLEMTRNFYIITRKTHSPAPLTQEIIHYLTEAIRQR